MKGKREKRDKEERDNVREKMQPMHALRLKNLEQIVALQFKGNATACAAAIGRSHTFLWQLINGYRGIGEASARHIEGKLGMKLGELDKADALAADRKLLVQMGNGQSRCYWMVPRIDNVGKKINNPLEAMPCPLECSEATVFWIVPNQSMMPRFRKGEKVYVNEDRVIADGDYYVLRPKVRGAQLVLRQARKLDSGRYLFVTEDSHVKDIHYPDREVAVIGRVIGCWHDIKRAAA